MRRGGLFHFPQTPGASLFTSLRRRALAPLAWLTRHSARHAVARSGLLRSPVPITTGTASSGCRAGGRNGGPGAWCGARRGAGAPGSRHEKQGCDGHGGCGRFGRRAKVLPARSRAFRRGRPELADLIMPRARPCGRGGSRFRAHDAARTRDIPPRPTYPTYPGNPTINLSFPVPPGPRACSFPSAAGGSQ